MSQLNYFMPVKLTKMAELRNTRKTPTPTTGFETVFDGSLVRTSTLIQFCAIPAFNLRM